MTKKETPLEFGTVYWIEDDFVIFLYFCSEHDRMSSKFNENVVTLTLIAKVAVMPY